jgi:general secretion pathway protein C
MLKRPMTRILFLNIFLSLLCLAVLAKLTADIISYRLSHTFPGTSVKAASVPRQAASDDLTSFAPIVEKGLFGSATQGRLTPIAPRSVASAAAAPATSQGDLVLMGTAVGSYRESFALIQKSSTHEERVFRLGDRVYGLGPLVSVRKEQVEVRSGSQVIKLTTPIATGTETGKSAGGLQPGQATQLATSVGSGNYVVDQRALNASLDNIGQAMTDARLLPNMKDGKVEGFRAQEVKPAGIFGMVGIRNGDVLMRINDFAIDGPEKAIQALVSLKGQSRIKLDLIRDGQPTTLNYDIR